MAVTARQLVTDALQEIRVVAATEVVSPEDLAFGLRRLNRLLDAWNADEAAVYADRIQTFTLVPGLQPHTIGPTGATWTSSQRPERLSAVNLVVDTARSALTVQLASWWMANTDPEMATSMPTDVYFDPTWPNGSLYFWPVPTVAYDVEILSRVVLGSLAASDTVTLPPGYQEALTLTLAEALAAPLRAELPPTLPLMAQKARARIFVVNVPTPPMRTDDVGVPSGTPAWFNWRSGMFS